MTKKIPEEFYKEYYDLCENYAHVLHYLEYALKGFQKLSRKNKSWKSEEQVNSHIQGMIKKIKDALRVVE